MMLICWVFASSLAVGAIALTISPDNFSAKLIPAELGFVRKTSNSIEYLGVKSKVSGDRTTSNPIADAASKSLAEGIYLYGQSLKPDELQKEYFVFELRRGKVVGAFYLPRSAFYCFYGNIESNRLNVTVVDSFDRTTSPYSVNLRQYHQISAISDNDRRILDICKAAHPMQV
ncbi:MAG: hypothetical protein ACRC62_18945 [Microcoleus sp.]